MKRLPQARVHAATVLFVVPLVSACALGRAGAMPPEPAPRRETMISLQDFKARIDEAGLFSGGPPERYEEAGRRTLAACIDAGLMPHHRLLDIGAGSLRIGWWLVQYIEPENYHAVEPVRERIDTAADILGLDINRYYNDDWEFPDVEFDFVLARSIWTHASKAMISKMLSEFAENAAPDGTFLTSVLVARNEKEDYQGEEWVGKVQKTDDEGVVRHSLRWIHDECRSRGLSVRKAGALYHQTWLVITRAPG